MPCALTQDYIIDCKDSIGGLKEIFFAEFNNVKSITKAQGVITAITLEDGAKFRKYQLVKDTAFAKETPTANVQNGSIYFAQELSIAINKMKANTRNEVLLLAQTLLVAIGHDRNGTYWFYGETTGLDLTGGDIGTGTAAGDRNGYQLTFAGQEPQLACEVKPELIPSLLVAAV